MATVKLVDGKVLIIDGLVSCACCDCSPAVAQWDSRSASKSKCGWPEFGTPSTPPKFYLKKSQTGRITRINGDYNDFSGSYEYSRPDCPIPTGQSVAIEAYDFSSLCGVTESGDTTNFADGSEDFDPIGGFMFFATQQGVCEGPLEYLDGLEIEVVITPTTMVITPTDLINWSGSVTLTLENEYTDELLYDDAFAALPAFPNTWTGTAGSYRSQTTDHVTIYIRESRYRFDFIEPAGDCFKIEWDELFAPDSGSPTATPKCLIWDGSPPPIGDGVNPYFELPIPTTYGLVITDSIVTSCDDCDTPCP